MAKNHCFTPEQVELLLANPYTYEATESFVSFTKEFKEFFYQQMTETHLTTHAILKLAGYDPELIGQYRMNKIRWNVRQEAASGEGFRNPNHLSHEEKRKRAAEEAAKAKDAETKIKSLQDRVTHLEAQIEFLKKTEKIRRKYRESQE